MNIIPKDRLIFSFTLTYILLLTTGTVTLIEALRTNIPIVRHIFNLETVISLIAGFFYSKFVSKINESLDKKQPIDFTEITKTRYLDWAITTPLMLLVLINCLAHHNRKAPSFLSYLVILALNWSMLYLGYSGEFDKQNTLKFTFSFVCFFAMYLYIFILYVYPKYNTFNYALFFFFFVVWSLYGIVYKMNIVSKNMVYNYLDLISKCFVGLGLWLYFTQLFSSKSFL